MSFIDDEFLNQNLNPLFLTALQNYWNVLLDAKKEDPQKILKTQLNLIRFLFRRLFQPLYLEHPVNVNGTLFLLTSVHRDGLGDYFATLKSAKVLKSAFSQLDIQVAFTHQLPVPAIDPSSYHLNQNSLHDFLETADRPILEPVLEGQKTLPFEVRLSELMIEREQTKRDHEAILKKQGQPVKALQDIISDYDREIEHLQKFLKEKDRALSLLEQLKESVAIVNIALAINTFDNPAVASKSLYFAEAGNFQGIANYLQHNWFSMGLAPFDEGLFLKKTFVNPAEKTNDQHHSSLHVAYLTKIPQQRQVFICLICLLQKGDPRSIDILLPALKAEERLVFHPDWLVAQGISEVVLVNKDGSSTSLYITAASPEKTLRLIQSFPLPPKEFENILASSGDIVGCTGDGSLSDCLIAEKIPFYELRKHKLESWQAFQGLSNFLKLNDVMSYLEILGHYQDLPAEEVAENLYKVCRKADFKEQWGEFRNFLKRYYCFENALISHLNRHLSLSRDSALKSLEEKLAQSYLEGKISSKRAYDEFTSEQQNRLS